MTNEFQIWCIAHVKDASDYYFKIKNRGGKYHLTFLRHFTEFMQDVRREPYEIKLAVFMIIGDEPDDEEVQFNIELDERLQKYNDQTLGGL